MKMLQKLWDFWYFCVLYFLICSLLTGCHWKHRQDPMADIPDLPADTVYVTKVISRCNYQYLNPDPKKARKQLQTAEKALDDLIAEYDSRLNRKIKIASAMVNKIHKQEENGQKRN